MEARPRDLSALRLLPWQRLLGYVLFLGVTLIIFWRPLETLARLALDDQRHTHVLLMPMIAIGLIGLTWRRVFENYRSDPWLGTALLLIGAFSFAAGAAWTSPRLEIGAIAIIWTAGFLILFGRESLRRAWFPFALLILFVPLPSAVLDAAEGFLQRSSADVTEVLFRAIGTPLFRDGMLFSIPGVNIEVARECSGIRSTIVLAIFALVLSYLFLRSNWSRGAFIAITVPISIFKNAIRIVSLSWLGTNVSMDFLTGDLHHRGGPIFSLLSLALMAPFLLMLQRAERRRPRVGSRKEQPIDPARKAS